MYKYLFGPVPSRRLGRSLGVDLVPLKVCSFNCVFCQAGVTTDQTLERKEYVPVADVMSELNNWLQAGGSADIITFSGSGEPTLHSGIGDVISLIRKLTDTSIALLTNSSLLHLPEVRAAIIGVDIIKASLSAWDNASLEKVNRVDGAVGIVQIIDGIKNLRQEFTKTLWLEIFLLAGINDDDESIKRIAGIVESIGPDRVHLNTVVRPPAEKGAMPVSPVRLREIAQIFDPTADVIPSVDAVLGEDEVGKRPVLGNDDC